MVAQIAELVDVQDYHGQEVLNVFHFLDSTGTADIGTLATSFAGGYQADVTGLQSNSLTHTAVRHRQVYPTASLMLTLPVNPPAAGTDTTGDDEPAFVAASIPWILGASTTLAGGFTGHLKRGGMRLCGLKEPEVFIDHMATGWLSGWAAIAPELLVPASGWELIIASFLIGNPVPHVKRARSHTVEAYALVTGYGVIQPSTQNTRKVLRGRTR